jgi:hypothetical protein
MLDSDLAKLYGVSYKNLNKAVQSNASRLHAVQCSARFGRGAGQRCDHADFFVRLRELLAVHKELRRKIESLEKSYDSRFQAVFAAIRQNARHSFSRKTARRIPRTPGTTTGPS